MKRPDLLLDDVYHAHRLKPGSRSGVGGPHRKVKISDEIHFPSVKPYGLLDTNGPVTEDVTLVGLPRLILDIITPP